MVNITISLDESIEKKLRELANVKYSGKKGSMAKVIEEAIEKLSNEKLVASAMARQIKWMKQGFVMGKINYRHRSELYERK